MRSLFHVLLRAFPISFRARYGPEILAHAEDEYADAQRRGPWHAVASGMGIAVDLVLSGIEERVYPSAGSRHMGEQHDRGVAMTLEWAHDLRRALRTLGRTPGFLVASVGTLALALGVTAAIFSVVYAVLLRPLPYRDADRLVYIAASAPGTDLPEEFEVSAEFYLHYRDHATQLEELARFTDFTATVRAGERVERLRQSATSLDFFELLGATPVLGRLPTQDDANEVVLLSYGLWTSWFGKDPSVIGRSYEFYEGSKEVIGVMGPGFGFPTDEVIAWLPGTFDEAAIVPGRFEWSGLLGRLAPGADEETLARELTELARQLPGIYGGSVNYATMIEQHVPVVRSVRELMLGGVETPLWVLFGAVGLVLAIACANVTGLFSVRAEGRVRDVAVKHALGAGRGGLIRGQLAESFVIATLAALSALVFAHFALPAFLGVAPQGTPRVGDVRVSGSTMLFTAALAVLVALVCGAPASLRSSRPDLHRLRDGGRGATRGRHRGRDLLVIGQTALALTLLTGSALLLRSYRELRAVDTGYDTENILTFQFAPEQAHLRDGPSWASFHAEFLRRLAALPGVERVGIVENVPLDEGLRTAPFATDARPETETITGPRLSATFTAGDYFAAMGIDVLQGRAFDRRDLEAFGNVVISESAAELLFPGENPIGRRVRNVFVTEWATVVGVVEDILQYDLRRTAEPMVYYSLVGPTPQSLMFSSPGYVVRSSRAAAIAPEIRQLVREVAPEAPMYRVNTMEALVARSIVQLSFTMFTLVVAAGLALILGAVGLYGVLSYVVAERTREIGVRMALGAKAGRVKRMVVAQGVRVVAIGILLGLGIAFLATRALGNLLYGVAAVDAGTFAATALVMAVVGALASYVPAHRAARVDPVKSMQG